MPFLFYGEGTVVISKMLNICVSRLNNMYVIVLEHKSSKVVKPQRGDEIFHDALPWKPTNDSFWLMSTWIRSHLYVSMHCNLVLYE